MMIYVTHEYRGFPSNYARAKGIVSRLQLNDLQNTYICPLMVFSHSGYADLSHEEEMALRLDLLSVCDAMIVASPKDRVLREEVAFAELIGMEVKKLEDRCL